MGLRQKVADYGGAMIIHTNVNCMSLLNKMPHHVPVESMILPA
jgi:hypothetical protein